MRCRHLVRSLACLVVASCTGDPATESGPPVSDAASVATADGPAVPGRPRPDAGSGFAARPLPPPPPLGPAATLPAPASGSRIVLLRWESADGASLVVGAQDTQLDFSCTWNYAKDGKVRCLPGQRLNLGTPRFADAACMRQVVAGVAVPAYLGVSDGMTCPPRAAIHKRGAKVDVRNVYSRSAAGACVVGQMPLTSDQEVFEIGDEIPADGFAALTAKVGQAVGNLAPLSLETEDGATINPGWHDTVGDFDCTFATASDEKVRCLPARVLGTIEAPGNAPHFTDATCTTPASLGSRSSCPSERGFLVREVPRTCPTAVAVHSAGARLTTAYFTNAGGMCAMSTAPASLDVFAVGPQVPPATFAEGSRVLLPGQTRLRNRAIMTAAGVGPFGGFWDTKLGAACSATLAADGSTRCIPSPILLELNPSGPFADPQCGERLTFLTASECPFPFVGTRDAMGRRHVFPVSSEPYRGGIFSLRNQICQPINPAMGIRFFALGPEIPAADMVELKLVRK